MSKNQYREWHELTPRQQNQAHIMFSATRLAGASFEDYTYQICRHGNVLCRQAKGRQAHQEAVQLALFEDSAYA